jgi:hypothetical protein
MKLHSFSKFISEKVEYHRELCPKVWNNMQMDEVLREKLLAIANDFWESLKLDIELYDIQLTGSLANYNWTNSSDLDVHLIIDFGQINQDQDLVRKALDGQRFIWNQRHALQLRGHDVECYVQHKDEQHVASGLFSILKNQWIITPTWKEPKVDEKDVTEKVRVIKSEMSEIMDRLKKADSEEAQELYDYIGRFRKKIQNDRKEGLAKDGEFSIENLAFKELRRDGSIEKIINAQQDAYRLIYEE